MNIGKKINWSEAKILYLLLWGGAFVITFFMIGIRSSPSTGDERILKNKAIDQSTPNSEAINELLLSAGQLDIAEKKSFISLYLKPGENPGSEIEKSSNETVYKQILQRKINKLKGRTNKTKEDFSIRPTPK